MVRDGRVAGSTRPDQSERVLLALVCLVQLAAGAVLALTGRNPTGDNADSVAFMLGFMAPAAYLAITARRGLQPPRAWYAIALGFLLFAASRWRSIVEPSAAAVAVEGERYTALWLLGLVFVAFGVGTLASTLVGRRPADLVLESLLVAAGAFAACTAVLSGVYALSGDAVNLVLWSWTSVGLFADLLLISMTLGGLSALRRPPASVWLLLLAAALFSATDLAHYVLHARQLPVTGGVLDLLWPLSATLVAVAWHVRTGRVLAPEAQPLPRVGISAGVLVAAGAVLIAPVSGPLRDQARGAAFFVVLLAAARMRTAVTSVLALSKRLQASQADSLTSLPNRTALRSLDAAVVERSTLLIVDLDGFGDIVGGFGWAAGDEVLLRVADRLAVGLDEADMLSRVGSDEFAVLLHDADVERGMRVAEQLVGALEAEMRISGTPLRVSACAGVSMQAVNADVERMIREAERALAQAKSIGTGIVRSFAGDSGERSQDRLHMRALIRDVLRRGGDEFVPYFQPIVGRDGHLLAVEALVRWDDGQQLRMPGSFIGEVTQAGCMLAFTEHMLHRSLRDLRTAGIDVPVTVNVSPDVFDADLRTIVRSALQGSNPGQLLIEITEDALMRSPQQALTTLHELRGDGVRVLLDDFGTGWSGLSSLRDLAVDGVKLDGSFIQRMPTDTTSARIVDAVATLAAELGILVIYEGVEDLEHLVGSSPVSSGYLQGYAIARPMPIDALKAWMAAQAQ